MHFEEDICDSVLLISVWLIPRERLLDTKKLRMQAYTSLHNFVLNILVCITCAEYASKHGLRGRSEVAEACFAASEGSNESHVYIYIYVYIHLC